MGKEGVKSLSTGVLQMKFMARTRKKLEEQEKRKKDQELKKDFLADSDALADSSTGGYQYCKDLNKLEDLVFGRMSFKGCNPEVEKLMAYYERRRRGEDSDEEEDEEKDVTDVQMAKTMAGASLAISNRFSKKSEKRVENETASSRLNFDESSIRKRKSNTAAEPKQPKFMKPSD